MANLVKNKKKKFVAKVPNGQASNAGTGTPPTQAAPATATQQGGVVASNLKRHKPKRKTKANKRNPRFLCDSYGHCAMCAGPGLWFMGGRPRQLPAYIRLIGTCTACRAFPVAFQLYVHEEECPCCDERTYVFDDGTQNAYNVTEDQQDFIDALTFLADGRSCFQNAMRAQAINKDQTIVTNGLAAKQVANTAIPIQAPAAAAGPIVPAALVAAPAAAPGNLPAPVVVVPAQNQAVQNQTNQKDLDDLQNGRPRYDLKMLYGDLFNAIDRVIYGYYRAQQIEIYVELAVNGYRNLFDKNRAYLAHTPFSQWDPTCDYAIWPDLNDQFTKFTSVNMYIYVDLDDISSVILYEKDHRVRQSGYIYGGGCVYKTNNGRLSREAEKIGEQGEFALWELGQPGAHPSISIGNFNTGFGKFLTPCGNDHVVVQLTPRYPYCRIIIDREAWQSAHKYVSGKPFTADVVRNLRSVVARATSDQEASKLCVCAIMQENAKLTDSVEEGAADNYGFLSWFYRSYNTIRRANRLIANPFGDTWKTTNIFIAFLLVLVIKLIYSRRANRAKSSTVAQVTGGLSVGSYPLWLVIMMVRKLWDNRVKKRRYTNTDDFNYEYTDVRGFRDLREFPTFNAKCMELVELKEMDVSAEVEEIESGIVCRQTFGNIAFGPILLDNIPIVPGTCSHNCKVAVVNRGCKLRKAPYPGFWSYASSLIGELIPDPRQLVELGLSGEESLRPVDFDTWFKHLSPATRRGISQVRQHKFQLKRKDSRVKGFVKRENTPCFGDKRLTLEFNPRLISGRTFEYQAKTGPITYAISKTLARFLHRDNCVTYASGMTAEDVGEWFTKSLLMFDEPLICETDASGFDGSVSKEAIDAELSVYRYLGVSERFLKYLGMQHKTFGYCGNVRYSIEATRKSGDGNTSCGNTTINALITHCAFRNVKYRAIILGDDGLIIFESKETTEQVAKRVERMWELAGFSAKVHVFSDVWLAQFCSGRFYPIGERYKFGMKIFRGLCKMGFSTKDFFRLSDIEKHRKGVGMGLRKTVNHIPILRAVAENYLTSTRLDADEVPIESYKMAAETLEEADDRTFEFVSHVYGLSRQQITSLERIIRSCHFPSVINVDFISRCCDIDASERRIAGVACVNISRVVAWLWQQPICRKAISVAVTIVTYPNAARSLGLINYMMTPLVAAGADAVASMTTIGWVGAKLQSAFVKSCETIGRLTGWGISTALAGAVKFLETMHSSFFDSLETIAVKMVSMPAVMNARSLTLMEARICVYYAIFGAPIIEEKAKLNWGMIAIVLIAAAETLSRPLEHWPVVFVSKLLLQYIFLRLSRVNYVLGAVIHALYNFLVMRFV